MLCTNGHNNPDTAKFCTVCGVNTFQSSNITLVQRGNYNGMAIAAMVLGIVWVYWIGSILALIFGYAARREIRRSGQQGEGMATAGIILGWIGVAMLLVIMVLEFMNPIR